MEQKNYRPNVGAIILSHTYPFETKIFLARRSDIADAWQFPQGGIDKGETPKMALFRELEEEIGAKKIEIVAEYPEWISYDYPAEILEKMSPYHGQIQKYFLVRLKKGAVINLSSENAEFDAYTYTSLDEIDKYINHFKKRSYMKVLKYFKDEGFIC
ncbi:MAG: RNA pyrophosphohydrolase [Campylobacteraceae bacterium]|nr:RNA pyrophosphohydrolase [Campylobacteraceae bacterium]